MALTRLSIPGWDIYGEQRDQVPTKSLKIVPNYPNVVAFIVRYTAILGKMSHEVQIISHVGLSLYCSSNMSQINVKLSMPYTSSMLLVAHTYCKTAQTCLIRCFKQYSFLPNNIFLPSCL